MTRCRVSRRPRNDTAETRGQPSRCRGWLKEPRVRAHEAGFDLRGLRPLPQYLARWGSGRVSAGGNVRQKHRERVGDQWMAESDLIFPLRCPGAALSGRGGQRTATERLLERLSLGTGATLQRRPRSAAVGGRKPPPNPSDASDGSPRGPRSRRAGKPRPGRRATACQVPQRPTRPTGHAGESLRRSSGRPRGARSWQAAAVCGESRRHGDHGGDEETGREVQSLVPTHCGRGASGAL
jgi:hypothetical protein